MIAVEIRINGKLKVTCGIEDLDRVSAHISAHGRLGEHSFLKEKPEFFVESFGVHQINGGLKEVLKWNRTQISFNDEISIKFVETENVSTPVDRQILSSNNKD